MNASDQNVYVGNKSYRRTVWQLRREASGRVKGLVRFAGKVIVVFWIGDNSVDWSGWLLGTAIGHWATHDNDA